MLSFSLLPLAAVASRTPPAPASDAWAPVDAEGTVRYSALGLFPDGGDLTSAIATVTKHAGNPLFKQDRKWEPRLDNGYPNVVYDSVSAGHGDGPWRLWYGGIGPGGQYLYYANSTDGLEWNKPNLNRYDLAEKWGHEPWAKAVGKKNNIIMFGGGLGIFHDLHEPNPKLRYKCSGGSPAGCYSDDGSKDCVVGTAGSPDGINDWTAVTALRFPRPWRPDCHTNLFYDAPTSQYLMTTRDFVNPNGREIGISHSGGAGQSGGGGKHWLGNWTLLMANKFPLTQPAGSPTNVKPAPGQSVADACGMKCRETTNCAYFFVYTTGSHAGKCFPKASVEPGTAPKPACAPPKCDSAFYKMEGEPTAPPVPPPHVGKNGTIFGEWSVPKIVEKGVTAHQLYSQITWRFYDIFLGIVMVFDATDGTKGPNAGHVHCMLSWSPDADTWHWVDATGLGGLKEFIPRGPLGSFESHVCFAAHSPLRMPGDGSTRLYYMGGNGPHSGARNSSFGLATLPPDRFAGLTSRPAADAVGEAAVVSSSGTSKTVQISGTTMIMTLDIASSSSGKKARAGASVTVTVKAVGGSGGQLVSSAVTTAGTDVAVDFGGEGLKPLLGKEVTLTLSASAGVTIYTLGFRNNTRF